MFFGVFPLKIKIRKRSTIVDSFRISSLEKAIYGVFQHKIKVRKLSTIVDSFRICILHFKTHVFGVLHLKLKQ